MKIRLKAQIEGLGEREVTLPLPSIEILSDTDTQDPDTQDPDTQDPDPTPTPFPVEAEFDELVANAGPALARKWIDKTYTKVGWYDTDRVFRFLANRTGKSIYQEAHITARDLYTDYVVRNEASAGWNSYPWGLYWNIVEDDHAKSKSALRYLVESSNFQNDIERHYGQVYSRPVAYLICSAIRYQQVGLGDMTDVFRTALGFASNHLRQWRTNDYTDPSNEAYMRPFMVGMTAMALSEYHEQFGNAGWPTTDWPNIPAALKDILGWMFEQAPLQGESGTVWNPDWGTVGTWVYTDRQTDTGGTGPTPDLNMLVAPAYAYLFKLTGQEKWRTYADRMVTTCIKNTNVYDGSPKQFNQLVMWMPQYLRWRSAI